MTSSPPLPTPHPQPPLHCYTVLLVDRKRGKPRHILNVEAIKQLLDAYEVPYTHLVDFRGSFEEQVRDRRTYTLNTVVVDV